MAKIDWSTVDMQAVLRPIEAEQNAQILAKMPDTVKVKNHLLIFGSITSQEAWRNYGITRLAAVIYKLRKRDDTLDIKMRMVYGRDRYDQPAQYGVYYI